jgi:putative ABC transport system substrate-binding protein
LNVEIVPKRLEVLRVLLPATNIMAVLVNPINYSGTVEADLRQVRSAAKTLGLETIHILEASTENVEVAFANLVSGGTGVISADTFFSSQSAQLAALALRHAVPTVSPYREFVNWRPDGYGASILSSTASWRLRRSYPRVREGADRSAGHQARLVINLKTAKTLGLEMPARCSRADEVVE